MKGTNIGYYKSGKVYTATLVEPTRINGILLMDGDAEAEYSYPTNFHEEAAPSLI